MNHYKLDDYDFHISEDRIRKYPLIKRDFSKLLVVDKIGNIVKDTIFKNITKYWENNL